MLGPLNFLLYIKDFSEKLEGKKDVLQFADDTSIICKVERNEHKNDITSISQKIEKKIVCTYIQKQSDKYLTENQLTLNADKKEMLFFTNNTNSDPEFTFKGKFIKPACACRYLGVQIDSNLIFENHLNSVLSKMANAILSLNLVRNQIPLKVRIDILKSVVVFDKSLTTPLIFSLRIVSCQPNCLSQKLAL